RFQTAGDFSTALLEAAESLGVPHALHDVAEWIRPLFPDDEAASAAAADQGGNTVTELDPELSKMEASATHNLGGSRSKKSLATLVGPGGTGKTRLALELARQQLSSYPRGVWVADLSEAHDVEGICLALGKALNVPITAGKTASDVIDTLGHAIEGRGELMLL